VAGHPPRLEGRGLPRNWSGRLQLGSNSAKKSNAACLAFLHQKKAPNQFCNLLGTGKNLLFCKKSKQTRINLLFLDSEKKREDVC
jgi:hypothetical protein